MFHDKSWNRIYFGVKRSKVEVIESQKHRRRGLLQSWEFWLLLILFMRITYTSYVVYYDIPDTNKQIHKFAPNLKICNILPIQQ